jgi:hypothetical protein
MIKFFASIPKSYIASVPPGRYLLNAAQFWRPARVLNAYTEGSYFHFELPQSDSDSFLPQSRPFVFSELNDPADYCDNCKHEDSDPDLDPCLSCREHKTELWTGLEPRENYTWMIDSGGYQFRDGYPTGYVDKYVQFIQDLQPDFAVFPDVMGDAHKTLELFEYTDKIIDKTLKTVWMPVLQGDLYDILKALRTKYIEGCNPVYAAGV